LVVEGVDHLGTDVGLVVRAQFGVDASWLDDADAHMPLGDFLPQGPGESVHGELGEVVDAVTVPCDAAGDRADVDDVGDTARTLLGGLKQVGEGGAGGVEQTLNVVAIMRSHSSASAPEIGPRSISPALLTRVSSRP